MVKTLSDRLVAVVVPRATAKASTYAERFCYCSGNFSYFRPCWTTCHPALGGCRTICSVGCEVRYRGCFN